MDSDVPLHDLSSICLHASTALFGEGRQHVKIKLFRLPSARVLWINQRFFKNDPAFRGRTPQEYADHILAKCAFSTESAGPIGVDAQTVDAYVDRYGGSGIGYNGGSGRAAIVNGYHVKGIGRTPLVSTLAEEAHASGGAYLEECVREAVMSELVADEFPIGAIPTLAIIDTGEFQTWATESGPKRERKCLLVRPCFVRPAHFERAVGFINGNPKEGLLDTERVALFFEAARAQWGSKRLIACYRRFWTNWAEQMAYAFVHRMPHCGNTSSNICLDGRLLDFGAMAAVPSWAQISTMEGGQPTGAELQSLSQAMQTLAPSWERYADAGALDSKQSQLLLKAAVQRYQEALLREMCRCVGLTRSHYGQLRVNTSGDALNKALVRVLNHYRREHFTIFDHTPMPRISWDLCQIWSDQPPSHLLPLRDAILAGLGTQAVHEKGSDSSPATIPIRCHMRARSRQELYRENFKQDVYDSLDGKYGIGELTSNAVATYIDAMIVNNRRDDVFEPEKAVPIGFARNSWTGFTLFRCVESGRDFAIRQWAAEDGEKTSTSSQRCSIASMAHGRIKFADAGELDFEGALVVYQ